MKVPDYLKLPKEELPDMADAILAELERYTETALYGMAASVRSKRTAADAGTSESEERWLEEYFERDLYSDSDEGELRSVRNRAVYKTLRRLADSLFGVAKAAPEDKAYGARRDPADDGPVRRPDYADGGFYGTRSDYAEGIGETYRYADLMGGAGGRVIAGGFAAPPGAVNGEAPAPYRDTDGPDFTVPAEKGAAPIYGSSADMGRVSEFFQRDSRRYDNGFELLY